MVLGYCPLLDRQRMVLATRLTAFPQRPDAAPDVRLLMQALVLASGRPSTTSSCC